MCKTNRREGGGGVGVPKDSPQTIAYLHGLGYPNATNNKQTQNSKTMKVTSNTTIKLQKVWESIGNTGKPGKKNRNKLRWQSRPGGVLRTLSESVRDHGDRWEWDVGDTEELQKVVAVLKGPFPPNGWDTAEYKNGEVQANA